MHYPQAALLMLLLAGGCSKRIDMDARLASLVETERAFAAASVDIGNRRAFLEYFADDAIFFRPHPVPARDYLQEQPDDRSLLTWRPAHADISRSGDLGYTTGPWEYRAGGPDDPQVIYGHYISVWKRQADGNWKVVIDTGTSNPPPESADAVLTVPDRNSDCGAGKADKENELLALMNRDRVFAITAREKGMAAAVSIFACDDIRVFRRGTPPITGQKAAVAAIRGREAFAAWEPMGARTARAGDLGYSYGEGTFYADADSAATARFVYLRIWKRSAAGVWVVAVDVMNPLPESPAHQ